MDSHQHAAHIIRGECRKKFLKVLLLVSVRINLGPIEINPLKFIVRDSVFKEQGINYLVFLFFVTPKTIALKAFICFYERVNVEIVAAKHLHFLYEVEVVKAKGNVLYDRRKRHREVHSGLVSWVTVFGDRLRNRVYLPELNSHVGVYSRAVGWFNIFAFEYVYDNLIGLPLNLWRNQYFLLLCNA